jgi:hypothetical protein
MGDIQEPEKVNDTCVKTMQKGMTNRSFTAFNLVLCSQMKLKTFKVPFLLKQKVVVRTKVSWESLSYFTDS